MQKDTEKLEQNTSWEKKFEKAKGTFEVYGEFGMGIDYKKLKEAFSKAITTAVAKRELEIAEGVKGKVYSGELSETDSNTVLSIIKH